MIMKENNTIRKNTIDYNEVRITLSLILSDKITKEYFDFVLPTVLFTVAMVHLIIHRLSRKYDMDFPTS